MTSLKRRLGNVRNELGVFYMNQATALAQGRAQEACQILQLCIQIIGHSTFSSVFFYPFSSLLASSMNHHSPKSELLDLFDFLFDFYCNIIFEVSLFSLGSFAFFGP